MMQPSFLRTLFGTCIGMFAGISFATGVLSFVITQLFAMSSLAVMFEIRSFILPTAILWAIGGGIVGWQGGPQTGGIVLGVCGAISGFILGAFAMQGGLAIAASGLLTGLVYGAIGGLIIGYVFPRSLNNTQEQ
jgi:hypothetical protein